MAKEENYELHKDEGVLFKSSDGGLMITNYRIRKLNTYGRTMRFTSMMLADVTSITNEKFENIPAKVIAILALLTGIVLLVMSNSNPNPQEAQQLIAWGAGLMAIGVALGVFYWATRKTSVRFKTNADEIRFETNKINYKDFTDVVGKIERYKIDQRQLITEPEPML